MLNQCFYGRYGVVIKKYTNRIVLQNPGLIRVGVKQLFQGGISDPRNKNIMKMFNLLGFGEKAGSGFPGIIDACILCGAEIPAVVENQELDITCVTIYNNNSADFRDKIQEFGDNSADFKDTEQEFGGNNDAYFTAFNIARKEYSENMSKIIAQIYESSINEEKITTTSVASANQLSPRRVREILNRMVDLKLLEESGSTRNRVYYPKKKNSE